MYCLSSLKFYLQFFKKKVLLFRYIFHNEYSGNKRTMGHITHLRNQFKSINTFEQSYDYIYFKIGQVDQEKIFTFLQFCYYLPMLKGVALTIWTNLNPLYPRMSLVKIGPVVLEKKIFFKSSMYFYYSGIISPRETEVPFF